MTTTSTKKYSGMLLSDGTLYLYEAADDLREEMILRGKDWQQVAWINSVIFCDKAEMNHRLSMEKIVK